MKRFLSALAILLWLLQPAFGQQLGSLISLTKTVTNTPAAHSVELTWTAASCTDENGNTIPCPSTPTYAIYRSAKQGGGDICANGLCYGYCCRIGYSGKGVLTYTDTSVAAGQIWYYVVTTLLPACPVEISSTTPPCGESAVSNEVQATTPGTTSQKKKKK
jgi:hypothetical protein